MNQQQIQQYADIVNKMQVMQQMEQRSLNELKKELKDNYGITSAAQLDAEIVSLEKQLEAYKKELTSKSAAFIETYGIKLQRFA